MARKGRDFELAYEWLYDLDKKYKVTCPAYVFDKAAKENREIDVLVVSIPAPIEPPVRSLRATLPEVQSHYSGGGNHHSGN